MKNWVYLHLAKVFVNFRLQLYIGSLGDVRGFLQLFHRLTWFFDFGASVSCLNACFLKVHIWPIHEASRTWFKSTSSALDTWEQVLDIDSILLLWQNGQNILLCQGFFKIQYQSTVWTLLLIQGFFFLFTIFYIIE